MRVYAVYRLDSAALIVDNGDLDSLFVEVLERRLYRRHYQLGGDVLLGIRNRMLGQTVHGVYG